MIPDDRMDLRFATINKKLDWIAKRLMIANHHQSPQEHTKDLEEYKQLFFSER